MLLSKSQPLFLHLFGEEEFAGLFVRRKAWGSPWSNSGWPRYSQWPGQEGSSSAGLKWAGVLQLVIHHPPGLHADFSWPPRRRLPGHDGVEGFGLCKGQNPSQVSLRYLQLPPDQKVLSRTLALHNSTLVIIFEVFSRSLSNCGLTSAIDLLIYKRMPNKKVFTVKYRHKQQYTILYQRNFVSGAYMLQGEIYLIF